MSAPIFTTEASDVPLFDAQPDAPKRIQRRRTAGWRMPEGAVYVGRPSRWGNPYVVGEVDPVTYDERTPEDTVALFRRSVKHWWPKEYADHVRRELAGKDLACWPVDMGLYQIACVVPAAGVCRRRGLGTAGANGADSTSNATPTSCWRSPTVPYPGRPAGRSEHRSPQAIHRRWPHLLRLGDRRPRLRRVRPDLAMSVRAAHRGATTGEANCDPA